MRVRFSSDGGRARADRWLGLSVLLYGDLAPAAETAVCGAVDRTGSQTGTANGTAAAEIVGPQRAAGPQRISSQPARN